jgi:murein DD-endopeptidase MepM/ murein hydrolase activator NlpD
MSDRIFKVTSPHMKGNDIKLWQREVKKLFAKMRIDCPIKADGDYGVATRSFTADLVHANGMSAHVQMRDGITPQLRTLLRNAPGSLNAHQKKTRDSQNRKDYRATLRKRFAHANGSVGQVHSPATVIITDAWGWHPGIHDGIDVVTLPDPIIFAMIKSKIIDVRAGGWWGLGAPTDPVLKAKGDGIIQMEVLENAGPFKKGMHIGYGHAEKALVKVGDVVHAGQAVGHAGFANAWHIHLMVNSGNTMKGVGDRDPRPFTDYARKHSYS